MIDDPENTSDVRERLSTTYGVNRRSVLADLTYFDVCKCFPEDVMHILVEGVVPYETKFLLKLLIDGENSGVAKGGKGGRAIAPPPNRKKKHSLKKAKSVEKLGGGGTRYILEAETDEVRLD